MFFRRQEGQYRETDRVTRFKLIKSGKHWLRAATSQFGLFKVMRGTTVKISSVDSRVLNDEMPSITGEKFLKGIAATGAILGGAATTYTVQAEEATVAVEKTIDAEAGVLAQADEAVLGNVQEIEQSQAAEAASREASTSQSLSISESLSVSESLSLSSSASTSASTSASESASTSASESASTSSSQSISSSASTSLATQESQTTKTSHSSQVTTAIDSSSDTSAESEVTKENHSLTLSGLTTPQAGVDARGEADASLATATSASQIAETTTDLAGLTASEQKKREEQENQLKVLGAEIGTYLSRITGTPNSDTAVLRGQTALAEIEQALVNKELDLTDVIKSATRARNTVVNAYTRANSGQRDPLNGQKMEEGTDFLAGPTPAEDWDNYNTATVGYVVKEGDATAHNSRANIYRAGTYLYATEGNNANNKAPGRTNIATRVNVSKIGDQVKMIRTETSKGYQWEIQFNQGKDPHSQPIYYFTLPKNQSVSDLKFYQDGNLLTTGSTATSAQNTVTDIWAKNNSKAADLRLALGEVDGVPTGNGQKTEYFTNVAGLGPNGVGRGYLRTLEQFAFEDRRAFYQTNHLKPEYQQYGELVFEKVKDSTANVFAFRPAGVGRTESYRIVLETTGPHDEVANNFMAGFRSLENSRHRNFLQITGQVDRYRTTIDTARLKTTFLKGAGTGELGNQSDMNRLVRIVDSVTGMTHTPSSLGIRDYSVAGDPRDSQANSWYGDGNEYNTPSSRRGTHVMTATGNANGSTINLRLPFRVVTQSDVYTPNIPDVTTERQLGGRVGEAAQYISHFNDGTTTYPDLNSAKPDPRYVTTPATTTPSSKTASGFGVKNIEWVDGNDSLTGTGSGQRLAIKVRETIDGVPSDRVIEVPSSMGLQPGTTLSADQVRQIAEQNGLEPSMISQIGSATKVGVQKDVRITYSDNSADLGDSIQTSSVFFSEFPNPDNIKPVFKDSSATGGARIDPVNPRLIHIYRGEDFNFTLRYTDNSGKIVNARIQDGVDYTPGNSLNSPLAGVNTPVIVGNLNQAGNATDANPFTVRFNGKLPNSSICQIKLDSFTNSENTW